MNVRTIATRTTTRGLAIAALVAALWSPTPPAFGGITNADQVVPEPARTIPTPGVAYTDPAFGTPTVRIADAKASVYGMMVPEYTQLQAWNADMTMLLVRTGNGGYVLDAQTFQPLHEIDFNWPANGDGIRWSPTDPLALFYTGSDCTTGQSCVADDNGQQCGTLSSRQGVLRRYRLVRQANGSISSRREMVGCFPEYRNLNKDSSFEELSDDGRYVALLGERPDGVFEAFSYDLVNRVKGASKALPRQPDFVAMSPSGQYLLIQWSGGLSEDRGMVSYRRSDMTYLGHVSTTHGHGDITRDVDGTEVLVQTNAANAYLLTDKHYIIKAKIPVGVVFNGSSVDQAATLSSGATVPLLSLDWQHNLHISCRNSRSPGWCVVSTYSSGNTFANGWQAFEDEIFKVYLDSRATAPHVERLAHHRSSPSAIAGRDACSGRSNYWAQSHATISPDGTRVAFGSNWRRICDTSDPVDTFLLLLSESGPGDSLRPLPPTNLQVR